MSKKEKPKVDKEALDRITKKVLAFRPSEHRKKGKQEKKNHPARKESNLHPLCRK